MTEPALLVAGLDLAGTFVFGLTGGTLAVRRRLDVFGVFVLATAAALAGGMLRDMLMGATPVAALSDARYLAAAFAAALAAFFCHPVIERLRRPVVVFDAIGLGLFAVAGCRKAIDAGLPPVACLLLGVLTATGGGAVRDLLVAEVPRVLREEIYALAALLGAGLVLAAEALDMPRGLATAVAVAATALLRLLAHARGWRAPRAPWT